MKIPLHMLTDWVEEERELWASSPIKPMRPRQAHEIRGALIAMDALLDRLEEWRQQEVLRRKALRAERERAKREADREEPQGEKATWREMAERALRFRRVRGKAP